MWKLIILCALIPLYSSSTVQSRTDWQKCLPDNIKPDEVISVERGNYGKALRRLTVRQRLQQLKARCRKGKLVDSHGRGIYFYKLTGCWGNPPADYLEILERQRREISNLKKRYTVIEMTCNPSSQLIP